MVARKRTRAAPRRRLQTTSKSSTSSRLGSYARAAAAGYRAAEKAARVYRDYRGMYRDRETPARTPAITATMNDYKKTTVKYGRPVSAAARGRKLVRQNQRLVTYGIRNYGAWNRGNGAIYLSSLQDGLAGTAVFQPVNLFDLTAVPQVGLGSASTTLQFPATHYRLRFTSEDDSASVSWTEFLSAEGTVANKDGRTSTVNPLATMYPIDSDGKRFVASGASANNSINAAGAFSFLESFKAELLLYGPKQAPTKWCLQLVQLAEEVGPNETTQLATAFWQQIAKPYGYSPLESDSSRLTRKYMKVLRTWQFVMDAPEASEDHLQARMRQVTLTGHLNRRCNYKWDYVTDLMNLDTVDTPENAYTANSEMACHVHPKARVYLMIRALTTFQGPEAVEGSNLSPSYDIKLAVRHRNLS